MERPCPRRRLAVAFHIFAFVCLFVCLFVIFLLHVINDSVSII